MSLKYVVFLSTLLSISVVATAQNPKSDAEFEHLKGDVKTVLTTVRTPQGHTVSQPVRFFFNTKGFFTQKVYYDTLGEPAVVVKYEYDKKNRLTKECRFLEPSNEIISQTTYSTDSKNRTVTGELFGIRDSMMGRTVYHYNKDKVITHISTFDENNEERLSTYYEYNDLGYISYATFTEGPNAIYRGTDKFRYDTDGHLAEHCSYYLTTLRQAFLYTYYYDEKGNWTEAYVFHVSPSEGYLYQIISRQITYYE